MAAGNVMFLHTNLSPKWSLEIPADFSDYHRRWQVCRCTSVTPTWCLHIDKVVCWSVTRSRTAARLCFLIMSIWAWLSIIGLEWCCIILPIREHQSSCTWHLKMLEPSKLTTFYHAPNHFESRSMLVMQKRVYNMLAESHGFFLSFTMTLSHTAWVWCKRDST